MKIVSCENSMSLPLYDAACTVIVYRVNDSVSIHNDIDNDNTMHSANKLTIDEFVQIKSIVDLDSLFNDLLLNDITPKDSLFNDCSLFDARSLKCPSANILVIFDVDQVLIDPIDQILSAKGESLKSKLLAQFEQDLGVEEGNYLYSILIKSRQVQCVEQTMSHYIANLQRKGINILALTAFPSISFGCIGDIPLFRETQLKELGYDFSDSFAEFSPFLFKDLVSSPSFPSFSDRLHRIPTFQNGILYTGTGGLGAPNITKAQVLNAFLDVIKNETNWKPAHIVFLDDVEKHLLDMHKFCEEYQIPSTLIHYQGALELEGEVSESLGRFQFEYLQKHKIWLTDSQAKKLMVELR